VLSSPKFKNDNLFHKFAWIRLGEIYGYFQADEVKRRVPPVLEMKAYTASDYKFDSDIPY
jgi:hypothetical protein